MTPLEEKHRKDLQRQIQATLPHLLKLRQQCITSQDQAAQVSVERFTRFLRNLQDELELPRLKQAISRDEGNNAVFKSLYSRNEPEPVTDEALTNQQHLLAALKSPSRLTCNEPNLQQLCRFCHCGHPVHTADCPSVLQP